MSHLVFVYGSLKRGFGNHDVLGGSPLIARTRTVGRCFNMISLGAFPAVLNSGDYDIEGELYEVDNYTLEALDMLEGEGSLYRRQKVGLASGHTAWLYFLIWTLSSEAPQERVKVTRNHSQTWLPRSFGLSYVLGREPLQKGKSGSVFKK